jgi:hypothetical protein
LTTQCRHGVRVVSQVGGEQDRRLKGIRLQETPESGFQALYNITGATNVVNGLVALLATRQGDKKVLSIRRDK